MLITVKELREALERCMGEMKETSAKMAGVEGEALETLEKSHEELYTKAKDLQEKLDSAIVTAEKEAEMQASITKAAAMGETKMPESHRVVETETADKKHHKHGELFMKFLGDGPKLMSGNELKALQPRTGNGFDEGADGACMPLSMKLAMMGTKWALNVGYSKADIASAIKASTMVSSSLTLGGYTIPDDFRLPVLDLPVEAPHIIDRATVVPCPTGEITMPKSNQTDDNEYGGMTGSWISEAGEKPKTDTTFEQVKIAAHEYAMHTQISHRLLSRSPIGMERWIATKGRQVCLDALDTAFTNGDGNGKPLGILQTSGIREVTRAGAGAVSNADLVKLKYALRPQHRARGVYLLEDGVLEALELLEDTQNRPLFKNSIANGPYDMIAGYPYVSSTRMPTIGNDGDVAFVDLSEYYVAMEEDIVVKRSDDFAFTNNVATIAIFVVVGGRLVQPRVASFLGDGVS